MPVCRDMPHNTHVIMRRVYLSLGSNLGDRRGYLRAALARLSALPDTHLLAESRMIETTPWGKTDQPDFLNMAVALDTALTPEALLTAIHEIEEQFGRERRVPWGPRTLDIDMLVYEGEERQTPALRLPHPLLTARRFVLEPLAEIAPTLNISGKSVYEWLQNAIQTLDPKREDR